jgi:SAM-dependent methyltransferase
VLTEFQYRIIRTLAPRRSRLDESSYQGASKLRLVVGDHILAEVRGKRVIEYGCGAGRQAIEMALAGAQHVTGVDIQEDLLALARAHAHEMGLGACCEFTTSPKQPADIIITIDAFEHFTDPAAVLRSMRSLLNPGGYVQVVFGYTWYHPLGGHLLSVFPWAHLLFSEAALMRWRSTVRSDGARRFSDVKGGLNQMTIRRFERLTADNGFRIDNLELRPIRVARWFHNRFTREFLTSGIRCRLVPTSLSHRSAG